MLRDWDEFNKLYPDRESTKPIAYSYLSSKYGLGIMPDEEPVVVPPDFNGIFTQKELYAFEQGKDNRMFALPYVQNQTREDVEKTT